MPNFRHKYRGVELLLVDDLQFFAGKQATLGELLHTIDALVRKGRQLVFTADRRTGGLAGLAPNWSRGCRPACLPHRPPDHETRWAFCVARRRNWKSARRMTSSISWPAIPQSRP